MQIIILLYDILLAPDNTFLVLANVQFIHRIDFDGNQFHTIFEDNDQVILSIDFDYR